MLRVVIDTNVCISALLKQGKPGKIVDLLTQDIFQFFYPDQLLEEIAEVGRKAEIASKYHITPDKLDKFLSLIKQYASKITVTNVPSICRDHDDDVFLECARLANCDYLISGDPDLLEVSKHGMTKIVSPAQFLAILSQQV